MADRTQNINIVYKVNTADVQKAEETLKRAKTANDNLNASAQKLSSDGSRAAVHFGNTIDGLKLKMEQLKAQIGLANQTDSARLNGLITQYKQVQTQLDTYNAKLKAVETSTQSVTQSLGGLYGAVKFALTAGLIKEAISATLEMTKLSGQIDGVKHAFDKLPNSILLMGKLKEATHGTVTEFDLMKRAVFAADFGIPVEKLGKLLEFAAARAQQTGLSVDYLVDSIVRGIGMKSILRLDNLGLSASRLKDELNGVSVKAATVGQVTDAVFKVANEELVKMGGYLTTGATRVDQMTVKWTELYHVLSKKLEQSSFVNLLTEFAGGAKMLLQTPAEQLADFAGAQALTKANNFTASSPTGSQAQEEIQREKELVTIRKTDIELLKVQAQLLFNRGDSEGRDIVGEQIKTYKLRNEISKAYINILSEYQDAIAKTVPIEKEQLGLIEQWTEKIKDLKEDIEKSTDTDRGANQERLKQIAELERLISVYSTLDDQTLKLTTDEKAHNKALEESLEKQRQVLEKSLPGVGKPQGLGGSPTSGNSPTANLNAWYDQYATFWDKVGMGFSDLGTRIRKGNQRTVEDERRAYAQLARDIENTLGNIIEQQAQSILQSEVTAYDARIQATKDFYDRQIEAAGDNSEAKKRIQKKENTELAKLERERAEASKRAALTSIIINTALGVAKALASSFPPVNFYEAGLVAAAGASEYLIASRAKYKEGGIAINGKGTGTSDENHVMISHGESIITAKATRDSMLMLNAINSGKLNDKMLSKIASNGGSQVGFDDSRLIEAITKQPKQDMIKIGSMTYEAKKTAEGHTNYVRNKYLG